MHCEQSYRERSIPQLEESSLYGWWPKVDRHRPETPHHALWHFSEWYLSEKQTRRVYITDLFFLPAASSTSSRSAGMIRTPRCSSNVFRSTWRMVVYVSRYTSRQPLMIRRPLTVRSSTSARPSPIKYSISESLTREHWVSFRCFFY